MAEFLAIVFVSILAVAFVSGIAIWKVLIEGWVLSIIWGWLIVPIFAVQPLAVAHAVAVRLVIVVVLPSWQQCESEKKKTTVDRVTYIFMELIGRPLLVLGFAWIVKGYI